MKSTISTLIAAIIVANYLLGAPTTAYQLTRNPSTSNNKLITTTNKEVIESQFAGIQTSSESLSPEPLQCQSSPQVDYYLGPVIPQINVLSSGGIFFRDMSGEMGGIITTDYYVGAIIEYDKQSNELSWSSRNRSPLGLPNVWETAQDEWGKDGKPNNAKYCSAFPHHDLTSAEVCDQVCPECLHVGEGLDDTSALQCEEVTTLEERDLCYSGGLEVTMGFRYRINQTSGQTKVTHNNIQFIYYGVPKSLPPRSKLSDNNPKNSDGDPRECETSRCDDAVISTGDPIDVLTGNFNYSYTDLSLETISGPLSLQRSYASQATDTLLHPTNISPGWTHNQNSRLIFEPDQVWFKAHTLNQYRFDIVGDHVYEPYNGVLADLVYNDGQYTLTTSSQSVYVFDGEGKLQTWTTERGYGFTYSYNDGKLSRVTEPVSGRYLQFNYLGDSLQTVSDSAGRQISFTYNMNNDLAGVTDVRGNSWGYTYDGSHRITSVLAPGTPPETLLTIAYDEQGRAYEQFDGGGNRLAHLDFNTDGSTTIIDINNIPENYIPDCRGLATRIEFPGTDTLPSYTIDRAFDPNFNLTAVRGYDNVEDINGFDDKNADTDDKSTSFRWSPDGANLMEMNDRAGNTTTFSYDPQNHLTRVDAPGGEWQTFNYTGPLISSFTKSSSLGDVTTNYTYTSIEDAPQPINLLKTTTDALGKVTSFEYDALGQLITITDADLNQTHFSYNATGQVIDITDALGRVTHFEYDLSDALTKSVENYDPTRSANEENQYNLSTSYGYDLQGRLVTLINSNDVPISRTTYDSSGRIHQALDALNNPTTYAYNSDGTVETITIAPNHVSHFEYDELGRVTVVRDSLNHLVNSYTYNPDDTIASETDAAGLVTSYTYDSLHRVIKVSDNAGRIITTTYNANGDITSVTDPLQHVTKYVYSDPGRLTAVIENYQATPPPGYDVNATNIQTEYIYDLLGNLNTIVDADGHATSYSYDDLYRLETVTDPLGHETTYGYDALGNQVTLVRPDGSVTGFSYDLVSRMTGIDYPGGSNPDVNFQYDALSQMTGMNDSIGHTAWQYDLLGRPTLITDPYSHSVAYAYDTLGNRTQLTYPGGRAINYQYNAIGLLEHVLDGATPLADYGYDNAGRLTSATYANGVNSSYSYDISSQLTTINHNLNGRELAFYKYTYDLSGNLTQIQEAGDYPNYRFMPIVFKAEEDPGNPAPPYPAPGGDSLSVPEELIEGYPAPEARLTDPSHSIWSKLAGLFSGLFSSHTVSAMPAYTEPEPDVVINYTYDALNRLKTAGYSTGSSYAYSYDQVGNRTSQVFNGITTIYNYDMANRLAMVNDVYYTWNDNGSLLNDGVMSYSYDPAGRLSEVTSGHNNYQFGYDGLGNRYTQTLNGGTTIYTLDLATGLTTVLREGTNTTYLYGLGLIGQEKSGKKEFVLADRLGSVRKLITSDNNQTFSQNFDPFGNPINLVGDGKSSFGYTGEQVDGNGLVYLRARYYSPQTGRFITVDPFPGLQNQPNTQYPYVYGGNNPLYNTDRSGLFLDTVLDAAFVAWDVYDINSKLKNNCEVSVGDWIGLGLDVTSLMIPFLPAIGGFVIRGLSHADNIYDASKFIDKSSDFFKKAKQVPLPGFDDDLLFHKKIPNPDGRNGGPLHRQLIKRTIEYIKSYNLRPKTEYYLKTPGGKKQSRFIDVVALYNNMPVAYYQIGKVTKNFKPVSRELQALEDISRNIDPNIFIIFIPYN